MKAGPPERSFGGLTDFTLRREVGRQRAWEAGMLVLRLLAIAACVLLSLENQCRAGSPATSAPANPASSSAVSISLSPDDRDALARVAYAEAGDQGPKGIA